MSEQNTQISSLGGLIDIDSKKAFNIVYRYFIEEKIFSRVQACEDEISRKERIESERIELRNQKLGIKGKKAIKAEKSIYPHLPLYFINVLTTDKMYQTINNT